MSADSGARACGRTIGTEELAHARGEAEEPRFYSAFGIVFRSDFTLDELTPAVPQSGAIEIARGPALPSSAVPEVRFELERERCVLEWPTVARFVMTGPARIEIFPLEDAPDELVALPLLGPVIALFLQRRGLAVLHGSSLLLDDGAAVFLGDKGAGKSSLAAACLAAGRRMLADDVVAVARATGPNPAVLPATSRIKLTPETDAGFRLGWAERIPPPSPEFPKAILDVGDAFCRDERPLTRICVLRRGPAAEAAPLAPREAMAALLRFSYVSRFGGYAARTGGAAEQFRAAAALAGQVWLLTVPEGLDRLAATAEGLDRLLARGREPAEAAR